MIHLLITGHTVVFEVARWAVPETIRNLQAICSGAGQFSSIAQVHTHAGSGETIQAACVVPGHVYPF